MNKEHLQEFELPFIEMLIKLIFVSEVLWKISEIS